jgi:hypothetical protein
MQVEKGSASAVRLRTTCLVTRVGTRLMARSIRTKESAGKVHRSEKTIWLTASAQTAARCDALHTSWQLRACGLQKPSTLMTRGRTSRAAHNASWRNALAAMRSRFGESRNSMVLPVESIARYK